MADIKGVTKENLGKYFIAGIIVAAIFIFILSSINKDEEPKNLESHLWSAEMDSIFVKSCYSKYKSQIKDDLTKQENTKTFCRCMLKKIKTKYNEQDMNKVTNEEIKIWDAECRNLLMNPK